MSKLNISKLIRPPIASSSSIQLILSYPFVLLLGKDLSEREGFGHSSHAGHTDWGTIANCLPWKFLCCVAASSSSSYQPYRRTPTAGHRPSRIPPDVWKRYASIASSVSLIGRGYTLWWLIRGLHSKNFRRKRPSVIYGLLLTKKIKRYSYSTITHFYDYFYQLS